LEKLNFICLHGFLGRPSDWDLIQSHFMVSPFARNFEWWAADYMNNPVLSPENSFSRWAANFNQKVSLKFSRGPRILIGYSLGGRLVLTAFKAQPELYDAVILLSTNPGLLRDKEKQERAQNDFQWSQKFLQMPWADLLREWNAQAVFKDSVTEPQRNETHFHRANLAAALTEWSLARQEDFRDFVAAQSPKILWLSGERDIKFLSISMELKKRAPALQTEVVSRASHRILFDNPSEVATHMIRFLEDKFT